MHELDLGKETERDPVVVYVPARGWWCRQCGVFRDLDDTDLCADCRVGRRSVAHTCAAARRRRSR